MPVVAASASTPLSAGVNLLSFLARLQLPNDQALADMWLDCNVNTIHTVEQPQEQGVQTPDHIQVD